MPFTGPLLSLPWIQLSIYGMYCIAASDAAKCSHGLSMSSLMPWSSSGRIFHSKTVLQHDTIISMLDSRYGVLEVKGLSFCFQTYFCSLWQNNSIFCSSSHRVFLQVFSLSIWSAANFHQALSYHSCSKSFNSFLHGSLSVHDNAMTVGTDTCLPAAFNALQNCIYTQLFAQLILAVVTALKWFQVYLLICLNQ